MSPKSASAPQQQRVRRWLGAMVNDWLRYSVRLRAAGDGYLGLCNRHETLERAPNGEGYRCLWRWTSDLGAPQVLPALGQRLMRRALADHPVLLREAPSPTEHAPEVTFIIGHRGIDRAPLLLATLRSIAAQVGAGVECIVVEQDSSPMLEGLLPAWVRHVHTPPPVLALPYCRSWALNVGARLAHGRVLVLHDGDLLVPSGYAAAILAKVEAGFELVDLKRFLFYLAREHSEQLLEERCGLVGRAPEAIMQNALGGSIAVSTAAFHRIGGMDESFIGWGGEDNEFDERAQTLRAWRYGHLPMVHLWHPAQPGKQSPDNPTLERYRQLSAMPAADRIARLADAPWGSLAEPAGWEQAVPEGTR